MPEKYATATVLSQTQKEGSWLGLLPTEQQKLGK